MLLYKIFMLIAVLVLSVIVCINNPEIHKPFVLEKENFEITKAYEEPKTTQTLRLLQLGEAPVDDQKLIAQAPKEYEHASTPIHLEPSEFYQYANRPKEERERPVQTSEPNQESLSAQMAQPPANDDGEFEETQPVDNSLKGKLLQRKEENIAWNKWRSDLQNMIMSDAVVEAPLGTWFFFSFKVDNKGKISRIKVLSSNPFYQKEAEDTIIPVIKSYSEKPFMKFPPRTKRKSVKFDGSYVIWISTEFSTPENYNDFERIQYYE